VRHPEFKSLLGSYLGACPPILGPPYRSHSGGTSRPQKGQPISADHVERVSVTVPQERTPPLQDRTPHGRCQIFFHLSITPHTYLPMDQRLRL